MNKYGRRLSDIHGRILANNVSGIDISDRNIILDCMFSDGRCILDGGGVSRIFNGINSKLTFDRISFVNGSATRGDFNGSGGKCIK